jgi:hypothetical protein
MTRWEERIAGVFAERFPRSAAAENLLGSNGETRPEDASGGRPFRLTGEQLFRDFETSPPDEKEAFLEALEALEQRGLVRIRWVPRRKREVLASLVFPDPAAFFAAMGKPSPAAIAAEARLAATEAGRLKTGDTAPAPYRELFRFLAAVVKPPVAVRGIDAAAVRDLA